ncbi:hypothetical protein WJX75_003355 [Coccomyxa subellipsoidea]|uniref:Uncharacterized protein n=1 Tax=Coccomyxa subellipsoidea TaxID=248742 RepID=A0ABR2YWK7_9CHLO
MGQYWELYNLTKREYVNPHFLPSGVKLYEITNNRPGVPVALFLLVAAIPGVKHPIVGRWAGDRIALIGDYAEEDDMAPEVRHGFSDILISLAASFPGEGVAATFTSTPPLADGRATTLPFLEMEGLGTTSTSGARVQPCHEVLTAVAARLEEPADVGIMRLVSKAWNAAATDGTITARLPKFSTGAHT